MDWEAFGSAMKQASQERRAGNRENSAAILVENGIAFESKSDGVHLIVRHGGKVADFWPGTGKWCVRGTNNYRRGVFPLLAELNKDVQP